MLRADQSCSLIPLLNWTGERNYDKKAHEVNAGRVHSPVTAMGKTDLSWGNLTSQNQNRTITTKTNPKIALLLC